jgi:hypothetical protein
MAYWDGPNREFGRMKELRISPKYSLSDWKGLDLGQQNNPDWKVAIDIFQDRIEGRFLRQVDELLANKNKDIRSFSGFVIIAIDCLLIETLEQFNRGVKRTGKDEDEKVFHDFFQRSTDLGSFFNTIDKTRVFYNQIRCGLLHQAQTKKGSVIHYRIGTPILAWIDSTDISQGISLNRTKFHGEVRSIFNDYLKELRNGRNLNLMRKMKRKMDFIANQS